MRAGARSRTGLAHSRTVDWRPNQLNLQVLHQHSTLSNPMGEALDYAKEFKSLDLKDNRCTMHRREAFDPHSRRIMHRTQVKSEQRPV